MKLTRDNIGNIIKVKITGIKGICTVEVKEFGVCDEWCRLQAIECSDKKFCCGDIQSFKVAKVNVIE